MKLELKYVGQGRHRLTTDEGKELFLWGFMGGFDSAAFTTEAEAVQAQIDRLQWLEYDPSEIVCLQKVLEGLSETLPVAQRALLGLDARAYQMAFERLSQLSTPKERTQIGGTRDCLSGGTVYTLSGLEAVLRGERGRPMSFGAKRQKIAEEVLRIARAFAEEEQRRVS